MDSYARIARLLRAPLAAALLLGMPASYAASIVLENAIYSNARHTIIVKGKLDGFAGSTTAMACQTLPHLEQRTFRPVGGITAAGLSNNNTLLVGSEQKMIEVSRKVIIVADATKFGRSAMVPLAPLDVADVVVSDSSLATEHRTMLRDAGVEIVLA